MDSRHDKSWNDPPLFSLDSMSTAPINSGHRKNRYPRVEEMANQPGFGQSGYNQANMQSIGTAYSQTNVVAQQPQPTSTSSSNFLPASHSQSHQQNSYANNYNNYPSNAASYPNNYQQSSMQNPSLQAGEDKLLIDCLKVIVTEANQPNLLNSVLGLESFFANDRTLMSSYGMTISSIRQAAERRDLATALAISSSLLSMIPEGPLKTRVLDLFNIFNFVVMAQKMQQYSQPYASF